MITARYKWDTDTLQRGFAIHRRTLTISKIAPIGGAAFLLAALYYVLAQPHSWIEGLPFIVFGVFLIFLSRPLAFWQFRRAVRRSPSYGSEMTYTFDPEQITNSGEGHHATFTWKKLYSATVTPEGILLYTNKNLFHWIPLSAFTSSSDMATVQTYLRNNLVRTKNA
jgi:hypothetical protein